MRRLIIAAIWFSLGVVLIMWALVGCKTKTYDDPQKPHPVIRMPNPEATHCPPKAICA